jgi:heme oxygenase
MVMALLSRLEHESRFAHADADAVWRELLARDVTVGRYMQLLVRVYGLEAPIEAALAYTPDIGRLVDLRARVRSGLIASDLLALQLTAAQIAVLPQCMLGPFADAAEALGWIYVLERATTLHDTVRRHVVSCAPALANATTYLSACNGARPSRWRELVRALDQHARPLLVQARVLAGARDAFRRTLEWFHHREPLQARGA